MEKENGENLTPNWVKNETAVTSLKRKSAPVLGLRADKKIPETSPVLVKWWWNREPNYNLISE